MQNTDKKHAILFVDDEEKALKYFSRLFSDEFTILTASNTEQAKTILKENHQNVGVLITDQRMPDETGVKLLKHAKDNYPNIIRLLTTAYSDLSDAIEAVNTGEILRYITKPWDIDLLRIELRHALRFFLLQNERDILLKEKLNTWLRLVEINKARDLIIFSKSFTKLANSQKAVLDFLRQVPVNHSSPAFGIESLDEWSLSKTQILNTLNLINQVTAAFLPIENYGMKKTSTAPLLKECCNKYGIEFNATGTLPDLPLNVPLFDQLIRQLADLLKAIEPSESIKLTAQSKDSAINLTLSSKNAGWKDISILNIPAELLASYLICYHHDGALRIVNNKDEGISFQFDIPLEEAGVKDSADLEEALDDILSRFEFWN